MAEITLVSATGRFSCTIKVQMAEDGTMQFDPLETQRFIYQHGVHNGFYTKVSTNEVWVPVLIQNGANEATHFLYVADANKVTGAQLKQSHDADNPWVIVEDCAYCSAAEVLFMLLDVAWDFAAEVTAKMDSYDRLRYLSGLIAERNNAPWGILYCSSSNLYDDEDDEEGDVIEVLLMDGTICYLTDEGPLLDLEVEAETSTPKNLEDFADTDFGRA